MIETKHAHASGSHGSRSAWLRAGMAAGAAALLVLGVVIGATFNSHNAKLGA